MAETSAASAIVHEVLNEDNYDEWKYPLVTYLMAQDLWDVIVEDQPIGLKQFLEAKGIARAEDFEDEEKANDEASKEVQSEAEIKAWLKKNATALHVIIISCGKDALGVISGIISAKKAWKTLEAIFEPPLLVTESSDSEVTPIKKKDENLVYQPFFDAVGRDDWTSAHEFLNKHPEALHIAVRRGYEQMVQKLIQVMREEDQEILDNDGATALVLALANGKTSIAKFMADKNRKILGILDDGVALPVCSAFGYGNINLCQKNIYAAVVLCFFSPLCKLNNTEVESLIESKLVKSARNDEGMTAREYFTENHEKLRKEGEKWMKDTASSYGITMTFAAGFIVPGITDESMRSLSRKKWFLVFLISDSVSLFSSTTSVLMSLGILTSRYYEEAFLASLPTKLILGMSALFLSIATMMLCFCAALYEMLQGQLWILIPIILLATVPVCLFIKLQFPLLVEIFKSTYRSGIGIAPKIYKKRWFFW